MNVKNMITKAAMDQALEYISKNPEENLPKALNFLDNIGWTNLNDVSAPLHAILDDKSNIWYKYIMKLWEDIDVEVLKSFFKNFAVNATLLGVKRQMEMQEKHGCNIPWAILMDPTSACNLKCTGCWAAEYGNRLNMTYEELDSIINQANELGTYFFLFSGGEPLVRKNDIIRLCEAHPDCQFSAFTNGTLIDGEFADEMLRVKNFIPAISVEGFEDATDYRRGKGTFQKVEWAMKILREKRLPFGISCCYTSKNVNVIGSEEYFDQMIEWGAKFCWFFTYMPVGNSAVPELMATAKQRKFMYHRIREFRSTKPIFTLDFWNDGEYVDGCIAGGRRYLHINAYGDYEPCAFIHYSDSNIREKTLLEALKSPLFMAYHNGQPFNENHLRPCPLLDNYGALARMVDESGAHSTDLKSLEDVHTLCGKCRHACENWEITANKLWSESHC
ncbi:MAG: radical SAM protein [Huintestinicola sp.]|uniref:radical SAM protein n=1 Tax=Huintestinicola sp. TaxID=2981661 RepID=UPI003EFC259C